MLSDYKYVSFIYTGNFEALTKVGLLYEVIFLEFIQGLDQSKDNYDYLIEIKKPVVKLLEELETLWILSANNILGIELLSVNKNVPHKIFCNQPTEIARKEQSPIIPMNLIVDEPTNFYYYSYSSWISYFDYLVKDLTKEIKSDISMIKQEMVDHSEKLFGNPDLALKENEERRARRLIDKVSNNINSEEIEDVIIPNILSLTLCTKAPLYSIMHFGRKNTLKHWDTKKGEKKKQNDVFDNLHSYIALAFCDYFITKDGGIKASCDRISKSLSLNLVTLTFEKFKILLINEAKHQK